MLVKRRFTFCNVLKMILNFSYIVLQIPEDKLSLVGSGTRFINGLNMHCTGIRQSIVLPYKCYVKGNKNNGKFLNQL